jgi:hypothetical protein
MKIVDVNVAMVQNFEVISDTFKVVRFCSSEKLCTEMITKFNDNEFIVPASLILQA